MGSRSRHRPSAGTAQDGHVVVRTHAHTSKVDQVAFFVSGSREREVLEIHKLGPLPDHQALPVELSVIDLKIHSIAGVKRKTQSISCEVCYGKIGLRT